MESRSDRIWTIPLWCADAHYSRGWWYTQPPELLPKHIKSGRTVRIYESPREYCERMAALDKVEERTERAAA